LKLLTGHEISIWLVKIALIHSAVAEDFGCETRPIADQFVSVLVLKSLVLNVN